MMTATEQETISLLVVDDHPLARAGLRTLLGGYPELTVIGEAATVAEALTEVPRLRPAVVLLDIRLPDGSGLEVCRHVQDNDLPTKVLVLTSFADDRLVHEAIAAGADGYLLKEISSDDLVHAIKQVAEGKSVLDPLVTRQVMNLALRPAEAPATGQLDLLSSQERRVIALVAEGRTNKEIGQALGLSPKTVKNYLSHALEKLSLSRRSQAAALFVRQSEKPNS
jgi:two-component system, NarL family, response regulator DevR